jgi:N-acetylneuraminic acid mutarotase
MLLTAALLLAAPSRGQIQIEWTEGPKLPQPLGGHVAAVLVEGIVVAGGTNWIDGKKVWRDEIYVLRDGAWKQIAKLPAGLTLPAAVVQDTKLYLLGGWYEMGVTDHAYVYANGRFERIALDLPARRAQAGGGVIGDLIYVVGGMTDPADPKTATNSVIKFERGIWKDATPLPKPLGLSAVIAHKDQLYVFGGVNDVDEKPADSADAFRFDPQAKQWTKLPPLPSARRGAGVTALDDRYILLVGGCRNDAKGTPVMSNEVLAYDTVEDRYVSCTHFPYAALCVATVVKDGQIYAIGGEDLPKHRTDRVVIGRIRARP